MRFTAQMDGLATAAGHLDRRVPLKRYGQGLLPPDERESIAALAARLDAGAVQPARPPLHHLAAEAFSSGEALLAHVREQALPVMQKPGPAAPWIVFHTGFPTKGKHLVGVAHQDRGPLGKQENCRVAMSLPAATWSPSLPASALWEITRRDAGTRELRSRFAGVRLRAVQRDCEKARAPAGQWSLIEWPRGEAEPAKY